ncbi:MAG: nucleoside hydrolase, partial [Anaerolineae bacterium]|nr:nucleoside hydrolase [Anaerolineae bacterium]
MMSIMSTKVLLDTDIGSDIDDAVCLAYLLAQPQCELLGITTVSGQPVERARIASAQCKVAGKHIPIYPGADTPLIIEQLQPKAPQAAALSRWEHETDFPQGEAIEFLRRTIRQHPNEITLLAIGPLTNIALLFKADPQIPSLLKSLVLMCGLFTQDLPSDWGGSPAHTEWNAKLDPHATEIVYRAARETPQHRSIGLDVTLRVALTRDETRARFEQHPQLHPVMDFAEVWFQYAKKLYFHDPLAALTIFEITVIAS